MCGTKNALILSVSRLVSIFLIVNTVGVRRLWLDWISWDQFLKVSFVESIFMNNRSLCHIVFEFRTRYHFALLLWPQRMNIAFYRSLSVPVISFAMITCPPSLFEFSVMCLSSTNSNVFLSTIRSTYCLHISGLSGD